MEIDKLDWIFVFDGINFQYLENRIIKNIFKFNENAFKDTCR